MFDQNIVTTLILALMFLVPATPIQADDEIPVNPVEVGNVRWQRDFQAALATSAASNKPIFLLFQEVPGCIGCKTFGSTVLTEPLLVEAIEDLFIPVLVFNNRFGGKDEAILRRYNEPSWNFQVIRFLDGEGDDLIPRKDQVWTVTEVAARMIQALEAADRPVPLYLQSLVVAHDEESHAVTGFSMFCFWTGEYKFGRLPGVVKTEAGWYGPREVTMVTYHTGLVTLDELVRWAANEQCAEGVYLAPGQEVTVETSLRVQRFDQQQYRSADDADQKKQLERWQALQRVDNLTEMQLAKLNSLAPDSKEEALRWLSPRQQRMLGEGYP